MKDYKITEYTIPENKCVGNFTLENFESISSYIVDNIKNIMNAAQTKQEVPLELNFAKIGATTFLHENALVIELMQYTDSAACKYDDTGKARVYVFEDEIVYVVTLLDSRLNKEPVINEDKVSELDKRAGKLLELPEEVLEPVSNTERIVSTFSKKSKELAESKKEILSLKRSIYFYKLQHSLDMLNIATRSL